VQQFWFEGPGRHHGAPLGRLASIRFALTCRPHSRW
jgi:hypothetical protein